MLHSARHLHRETGLTDLCLAGGVALNCVANGRLLREGPFENVFVQPAAADGGCSVGCAYYGSHVLGGRPRDRGSGSTGVQRHAYLGRSYPVADVEQVLADSGLPWIRVDSPARLAAELLAGGDLLGWFTGGAEFGPRALGHRSILADPRKPDMKDVLNARVKHREWFRPFAPAILAEHAADYFEMLPIESPYMLLVASVVPEKRSLIPAVVHVDGSARVQTVTRADNGAFYELIEHFYALTGVPAVLNTSYNDRGQPIVETPAEALDFFGRGELNYLFLEDCLVAHSVEDLERLRESLGASVS